MEIIPFIKYWIPHVVILEPKWLAVEIKKDVEEYLNLISS